MTADNINNEFHSHDFGEHAHENERRTLNVIILTGITMLVEIVAGVLTGSMALLADGWHMSTHAFALGITYFAYVMARKFAGSAKFGFGTGKFGVLSGYTSALFLGATAIYMIVESVARLMNPVVIAFDQAILVAVIGLVVNVFSIWLLHGGHLHYHADHDHDNHEDHEEHDHHGSHHHAHDHNLRAAYLHVVADALTSILAIFALLSGKFYGWSFLDPFMGIIGGGLIIKWAYDLVKSTAFILLDGNDKAIQDAVITAIESDGSSKVEDLHIWPLNSNYFAAAITVLVRDNCCPSVYNSRLAHVTRLKHTTIEIHVCTTEPCPYNKTQS
jgi:cation diffusion facilitator family transporter